ncbi:MAG: branched-chain amino acid ABC transporter permease [Chloroflexota bacterium]
MSVIRPSGDFDRSYKEDNALFREPWHWALMGLAILAVATSPFWAPPKFVIMANRIGYWIIAVQGLNILTGYTGQISLGQAAFMLAGGLISAVTVEHWGIPVFLAYPIAALGTGLIGMFFGLPSLRVKGFYLAMATLAAQFIIPWISLHLYPEYLGGSNGIISAAVPTIGTFEFNTPSTYIYITLVAVIISTFVSFFITRTRLGRAFVAIRDNDLAAELMGVNLYSYKLRAFFIAAMFAGLAGALKAHSERAIGTELGYTLVDSIFLLGMLVVGGLGTRLGPFLGATFIIWMEDISNIFGGYMADILPLEMTSRVLTSFRPMMFGIVLMIFLIFEPRGLAHRWQLLKAAWRLRPFSH